MSVLLGITLAFVVFLIVVLVHEWGHFITARLTGMRVEEFGFGIPPKVARIFTDKKGTEFTLNALPIGGFVRILGEDPTGPDAQKEGAFITKPWISRALVLVAGVTMNFVLAWMIFFVLFSSDARPLTIAPLDGRATGSFFLPSFSEAESMGYVTNSGILLTSTSGSIAEKAGVGSGDTLIRANGRYISSSQDLIDTIRTSSMLSLDVMTSTGLTHTLSMVPQGGKVGMYIGYKNLSINSEYHRPEQGIWDNMTAASHETVASTILTFRFLGSMIHGLFSPETPAEHEDAKNMLSGPIGVGASFVTMVDLRVPVTMILLVVALLSINLGVVNILPFPALDGGRLISTTIYSLMSQSKSGSKKFLQVEQYFHAFGFLLLLGLMLYVAGLDISRFF